MKLAVIKAGCYWVSILVSVAAIAAEPKQTDRSISITTIVAQHPDGKPYVIVINNMRTRMVADFVQEQADKLFQHVQLLPVQIEDQIVHVPKTAFDDSRPTSSTSSAGVKRWDAATNAYVPYSGTIDTRYLPYVPDRVSANPRGMSVGKFLEKENERRRAMTAYYSVDWQKTRITPLAYAGQGLWNAPDNDVWIRDPKGRSFFVDGNEWVEMLKFLAGEGEGRIPALRMDVWDLMQLNDASRNAGNRRRLVGATIVLIVALGILVWNWRRKRRSRAAARS